MQVAGQVDEADDGHAPLGGRGHLAEGLEVGGHEPGLQQEVVGWVPGDGQLGEGGDVGPRLGGDPVGVEDPLHVAVEVTDAGVDLAGGDAQAGHRARLPTAETGGPPTPAASPSRSEQARPHHPDATRRYGRGVTTVLGLLLVLVLFFAVPFVLVVTFAAARARRELRREEAEAEGPPD